MDIKLDCGRTVTVEALHYECTYAGLLEGRPSERMNQAIVENAGTKMATVWGERRTYVVPPRMDRTVPGHPALPAEALTVWLTCSEPIHRKFMGSELVVVLFVDRCWERPMGEVLSEGLRGLAWDRLAQDFDY